MITVLVAVCTLQPDGLAATIGQVHGAVCRDGTDTNVHETITWWPGPPSQQPMLDAWCRGVGTPLVRRAHATREQAPSIDQVIVATWNIDLDAGEVRRFVDDLRRGELTHGRPPTHFVLLLQDVLRRDERSVPRFAPSARSARPLGRESGGTDLVALAASLDLDLFYVPAMRNGDARREDRGLAILSTEPLHDPTVIELPLVRQRRVALTASMPIDMDGRRTTLQLVNVHFDARGTRLGVFGSPRRAQLQWVLDHLPSTMSGEPAATILGGDFNTIGGGSDEAIYREARVWSRGRLVEDPRPTHVGMGRLDYLFPRLPGDFRLETTRVGRYGSDHHAVVGAITP